MVLAKHIRAFQGLGICSSISLRVFWQLQNDYRKYCILQTFARSGDIKAIIRQADIKLSKQGTFGNFLPAYIA
jgi:hypothetical protein